MANEKRLIDANALLEAYWEEQKKPGIYSIEKMILYAPTVDAVELVRCKDCKHYMTIHCTCDGCCISDDWYCADGERKDNDI